MSRIAILGAGSIGCFIGAHWAKAGHAITLIGRDRTFDGFRGTDLQLTGGLSVNVPPGLLTLSTTPEALEQTELIFVSVKSTSLDRAIKDLYRHSPTKTPVVSLLNGITPAGHLRRALPDRQIIAGMVPFNVVWNSNRHLHRSNAGKLTLERNPAIEALAETVQNSGVPVALCDDIEAVQYGKLLLNLVNPINALSGISLHAMLSQRQYRRIYSAVIHEALSVYYKSDIRWVKVGPVSPKFGARILRLPDWAFNRIVLKKQGIDPESMTSMAVDLANGRETEIEMLNGEIVRLAEAAGTSAPLNAALVDLVQTANGPLALSSDTLSSRLGL